MKVSLSTAPVVFARAKGPKGAIRELRALISPSSDYTIISYRDVLHLGYNIVWRNQSTEAMSITLGGIMRGARLALDEVSIGNDLTVKNVEAFSYELPDPAGVDIVLGKSFLKHFSLTFDYTNDTLTIEPLLRD